MDFKICNCKLRYSQKDVLNNIRNISVATIKNYKITENEGKKNKIFI